MKLLIAAAIAFFVLAVVAFVVGMMMLRRPAATKPGATEPSGTAPITNPTTPPRSSGPEIPAGPAPAPAPAAPTPAFKLIKATWTQVSKPTFGTAPTSDVTRFVAAIFNASNGTLNFGGRSYNLYTGAKDPAPDFPKKTIVDYEVNGVKKQFTVSDSAAVGVVALA